MTAAIRKAAGPPDPGPAPLRVLCISHTGISRTNGRLRYAPLLERPDLRIELLIPDRWSERGRWQKVDAPQPGEEWVHTLPIRWPRVGPAAWHLHHYIGLESLIRRLRPQVIHLWQEPWSLVTMQTLRLRNRLCPHVPLVLEVDQNILKRLPTPFEQFRRRVLRETAFVLGRSEEALSVVRSCGYDGPAALIDYGVDRGIFKPIDREAARAVLGFQGFTVGYAGRLVEEKGIDDLIDAIARVAAPITLAILGEGPHKDALLARSRALGLTDRLRLWPWGSPHAVARFMGAVDVLALLTRTTSSVREQFGRVIIEAHACGTPVIGSRSGAIPRVVGSGGWVVPERDPDALAQLLDRLAGSPAELQAAALRGQEQIAQRFSFEKVADVLADAWSAAHARGPRAYGSAVSSAPQRRRAAS